MQSMNELESWLDVAGYEGLYQVSNLGRVKSLGRKVVVRQKRYKQPRTMHWKSRILKPAINKPTNHKGSYVKIVLRKDGISRTKEIHRLVAAAFIPNPDNKPVVNHIDFDGTNNHFSNLEWCTVAENNRHSNQHGRIGGNRKLTKNKVRIVRVMTAAGFQPKTVAKLFNTSRTNVIAIRDKHTWKHI